MFDLAVCRSTGPVNRSRSRSTDMHRTCTQPGLVGRSTRRSTVQRALLSGKGPGRPAESSALCIQLQSTGQRAVALWIQAPSTEWSTGGTTVRNLTVVQSTGWSIGRAKQPFPAANGQILDWGYKYLIPWLF